LLRWHTILVGLLDGVGFLFVFAQIKLNGFRREFSDEP
jgi:hypothetical protein